MKNNLSLNSMIIILKCVVFLTFVFEISLFYYLQTHLNVSYKLLGILFFNFLPGLICGVCIMYILLAKKDTQMNVYKRELEKESISSTEASSQIKVLQSKIKVLERALDQALNK